MINNQSTTLGTAVSVNDLMFKCCKEPTLTLGAFRERTNGEFKLFLLDEIPSVLQDVKPFTVGAPRLNTTTKEFEVKKIGRMFSEYEQTDYGLILNELGNNKLLIAATADIAAAVSGTFTGVAGLDVGDLVRVIKGKAGGTIPTTVVITAIDSATNTITFDAPVTIDQDDYIQFLSAKQADCSPVTKGVNTDLGTGRGFTFYYKIFSRTYNVQAKDYNKCFNKNSDAQKDYMYLTVGKADQEIWEEASKLFRHGRNVAGPEPEPMGYETVCSIREADGIETVIDFSALVTAKDINDKLTEIWTRSTNSPIASQMTMIFNDAWLSSYKAVHRKLREDGTCVTLNNCDTLYYGLMKYESDDFNLPEMYKSRTLTEESPVEPLAYILPKDLIALFMPPVLDVTAEDGTTRPVPNAFGKMVTEKVPAANIRCKSYQRYMILGYVFGGITIRDMYFKLTNFNFS